MKKSFLGALIILVLLFIYWKFNTGPISGNPNCIEEKKFKSYEFEAEVVNKYEGGDAKAITLVTFKNQPATIDFTLDLNETYEKLNIGDTLRKKFGSLILEVNNLEKQESFELNFNCK